MTFYSGSFLFMAPEICLKEDVDVTCDLWSLGVVMYNMMYCRNLFNLGEDEVQKTTRLMRHRTPLNVIWFLLAALNRVTKFGIFSMKVATNIQHTATTYSGDY